MSPYSRKRRRNTHVFVSPTSPSRSTALPTEGSDPQDLQRRPIERPGLPDLMSAILYPPKIRVPGRRGENTMDPVVHEVRTRCCLHPTPPPHRNGAWHLPLPLSEVLPQALRTGVLPRERTSCRTHNARIGRLLPRREVRQRIHR